MAEQRIIDILILVLTICDLISMQTLRETEKDDDAILSVKMLIAIRQYSATPYEKFRYTYSMFNACLLRYYQKREVCLRVFTSEMFHADLLPADDEYADLSCRKIIVDASLELGTPQAKTTSISAYKCPRPYQDENLLESTASIRLRYEQFFLPVLFYVSGGIKADSTMVSYQYVGLRTRIKPTVFAFGLPRADLSHMLLLRKFEPYQRNPDFYKRRIKERRVLRRVDAGFPIHRYPPLAEMIAAHTTQIKRFTAYKKFEQTFNKLNVCSLKKQKKLLLCRQVFQSTVYRLVMQKPEKISCRRRRVVLNFTPDKKLTAFRSAVLPCPVSDWQTANDYLLASSFQNSPVIAFIQINPFKEVLPDAIITEVDREDLDAIPDHQNSAKQIELVADMSTLKLT